jgi:LPXTG-site transpeptidase (sortase) family protein
MATMPPIANNVPAEPVRMVIDAIGLDQPIFAVGLDADQRPIVLKHAVGWYHYSAMPGTGENVVLWGHVLRFRDSPDIAAPFANLHHVAVGTPIVLTTANGTSYTYVVIEHIYATPNQVDYILPQGQEMLTLVSCIGEQIITETSVEMSHRLITRALPMP